MRRRLSPILAALLACAIGAVRLHAQISPPPCTSSTCTAALSSSFLRLNGSNAMTAGLPLFGVAFASLPASANGTVLYCSDCTKAATCVGGGTGALASRENGAWSCGSSGGGAISGTSGTWTVATASLQPVVDNVGELGSTTKHVQNLWMTGSWKNTTGASEAYQLNLRTAGTGLQFATEAITGSLIAFQIVWGAGSPEGVISARVGSMYLRQDGGAGTTLYIKESGTGSTGWIAK